MDTIVVLNVVLGGFVGFSLGLTGGGGAIFAVPILVYTLGVPAREAIGISLLTVGSTAFVGFVQRARRRNGRVSNWVVIRFGGNDRCPNRFKAR